MSISLPSDAMPVRLPPGRPKLATNPLSTGSVPATNTTGMEAVALLGRRGRTGADRDNDVDLRSDEISRKGGKAFALALGVPLFRGHVLALDPAEGAQSLAKGRDIGWDSCQRKPSDPDPAGVLRLGGERGGEETAAQCGKERSTVH